MSSKIYLTGGCCVVNHSVVVLLTMRHVTPYKSEVQEQFSRLSDTTDTLELWLKVQLAWGNLESVFLSGDIARQLPREGEKIQQN